MKMPKGITSHPAVLAVLPDDDYKYEVLLKQGFSFDDCTHRTTIDTVAEFKRQAVRECTPDNCECGGKGVKWEV